jgi:pseudouridine-5'-phosphate glycosidase
MGKDITPFVLARVSELTGEESKRANTALLKNNAAVAARIALALSKIPVPVL